MACAVGIDGMALLRNNDPLELLVAQVVVRRAVELQEERDANLARAIRNEIAEAFRG